MRITVEEEFVSRVILTPLLTEAFNFIPGVTLKFEVEEADGSKSDLNWEVFVDAWNQSYIYCKKTKSFAYFVNNGTLHYFTEFVGNKKSMLYHFYLAANKVLLGYYGNLEISDNLPINGFYSGVSMTIQDFIAPFHIYLKAEYRSRFTHVDEPVTPGEIMIESKASVKAGSIILKELFYSMSIKKNRIDEFKIVSKQGVIKARCIN